MHSTLDVRVLYSLVEEREARLRRTSLSIELAPAHRPVRRWVGRNLVRFGSRLAGEPPMRPVRAP
ncbi:MAG: hypothetical protein M3406_13280 [Chloroflexota bacterium]|nr:hypothetical protein [Chloroflexota bacterium]